MTWRAPRSIDWTDLPARDCPARPAASDVEVRSSARALRADLVVAEAAGDENAPTCIAALDLMLARDDQPGLRHSLNLFDYRLWR